MAYSPEQIDKGPIKKHIGQKTKKFAKKSLHRRVRRTPITSETQPSYTKYKGWVM